VSLRIGVDLDGVLADFASAYRSVKAQLALEGIAGALPEAPLIDTDDDGECGVGEPLPGPGRGLRLPRAVAGKQGGDKGDSVWERICRTENFWSTLAPIHPAVIPRLNRLARTRRWDVYFITRRPETAGESVQRQTHRWLVAQGFDTPSVLVVRGPRGTLAGALNLDFMIDDSHTGCVDVISDSSTKVFMVVGARPTPPRSTAAAKKLGISPVASVGAALDAIEEQTAAQAVEGWLPRLSRLLRFEPRGA